MNPVSLLFAGGDARTHETARAAAAILFQDPVLQVLPDLDHALGQPPNGGPELLFLMNPTPSEVQRARDALDSVALPRWAMVVFGEAEPGPGVEVITGGHKGSEATPAVAVRAMRSSLFQHAQRREIARLRGDLLTIGFRIAHDLRSPLGAILATGELLKEELVEKDPAAGDLARPLFESTDHLMDVISRVSQLTKASGRPSPAGRVVMAEMVSVVTQKLERRIQKAGASVKLSGNWPVVQGVEAWIEVIWANLISNALRHGGDKPQIELGWESVGAADRFWVADRGPGVPESRQPLLFPSFHLLHHTNAPRGLGLAIVRRLVELQSGTCGFAPRLGGGSLFFFTLPRAH